MTKDFPLKKKEEKTYVVGTSKVSSNEYPRQGNMEKFPQKLPLNIHLSVSLVLTVSVSLLKAISHVQGHSLKAKDDIVSCPRSCHIVRDLNECIKNKT